MSEIADSVKAAFEEAYGSAPECMVRAPGRVNIIGEHTDYNDGFVLPMAIDRAVWIAVRGREDKRVLLYSLEQEKPADFDLDHIQHSRGQWSEYVKGMAVMLQQAGYQVAGWEGILSSDVPVGSGLSSSAALEMATGRAFCAVSGFPFDGVEMAPTIQLSEENLKDSEFYTVFNNKIGTSAVLFDAMQSEEGGRFFQEQNRNMVIEIDEDLSIPDNFLWMTVQQLKTFLQYNNYVNIQSRSILASLPL